jgi:DNA-binding transcriptional regulator YhcF (GntR family)/DNA-binding LacI/PurR family transcriptional regulator
MVKKSLAEITAGRLLRALPNASQARLPPMRSLASDFGVSYVTMSNAAAILRRQGVLEYGKGRGLRTVPHGDKKISSTRVSAVQRVAALMKESFEEGAFHSGEPLPKIATLVQRFLVSNSTMVRALHVLEAQKIIHKSGKRWIGGPAPVPKAAKYHAGAARPTLIIVQRNWNTLYSIARSKRTVAFYAALEREAVRYGVSLVSAYKAGNNAFVSSGLTSKERIAAYIRSLGGRYLGALIIDMHTSEEELRDWTGFFCAFGKPVALFDRTGELPQFNMPKNFVRCHYSEGLAVACAIDTLHSLGHEKALFMLCGTDDWRIKRGHLLTEAGRERGMKIAVIPHRDRNPDIPEANRLERHAAGREKRMGLRQGYIGDITQALRLYDVTAWIVARDLNAIRVMDWLLFAKYQIPKDVSLLSFDNWPAHMVSSVDPGFNYLGYAAFHTIFGMLPVKKDRHGSIAARPHVVDKATLGPPRAGVLRNLRHFNPRICL